MTFRELMMQIHRDIEEGETVYVRHRDGGELHIALSANDKNRMFFDWFPADSDAMLLFQSRYIAENGDQDWIDRVIYSIACNPESTNWRITYDPRYVLLEN